MPGLNGGARQVRPTSFRVESVDLSVLADRQAFLVLPSPFSRLGIDRVRVILPPLALILQVVGGGFRYFPPKISIDHLQGKIDAAGQTPRRSKVAFLDKPDAAYDMDLGKVIGEVFVCRVVSGGRLPVEQSSFRQHVGAHANRHGYIGTYR